MSIAMDGDILPESATSALLLPKELRFFLGLRWFRLLRCLRAFHFACLWRCGLGRSWCMAILVVEMVLRHVPPASSKDLLLHTPLLIQIILLRGSAAMERMEVEEPVQLCVGRAGDLRRRRKRDGRAEGIHACKACGGDDGDCKDSHGECGLLVEGLRSDFMRSRCCVTRNNAVPLSLLHPSYLTPHSPRLVLRTGSILDDAEDSLLVKE